MNKLTKTIFVLFFIVCKTNCFAIQEVIKTDSSSIKITYFKENIKERYQDGDFNYSINDTGGVNLIQSVFKKFFGWISDVFGFDIDVNYKTLELIVYCTLGLLALYLFIRFLMQSPVSSVFRTPEKDIDDFKYIEENLSEINFETLIQKALKEKNYRLATRYKYLSSLKALTKKELICWNYDKTNSDYVNEIKDNTIRELFKNISRVYDYVWYGEFPINEDSFNKNEKDFKQLLNAINNG